MISRQDFLHVLGRHAAYLMKVLTITRQSSCCDQALLLEHSRQPFYERGLDNGLRLASHHRVGNMKIIAVSALDFFTVITTDVATAYMTFILSRSNVFTATLTALRSPLVSRISRRICFPSSYPSSLSPARKPFTTDENGPP